MVELAIRTCHSKSKKVIHVLLCLLAKLKSVAIWAACTTREGISRNIKCSRDKHKPAKPRFELKIDRRYACDFSANRIVNIHGSSVNSIIKVMTVIPQL